MFDLVSNNHMIQMMDRSMSLATKRMSLIAGNLANIDTPNYQARDFSFEDAFQKEMTRLDRQFSPTTPSPPSYFPSSSRSKAPFDGVDPSDYERNDRNDVKLDQQTMLLAKTQNIYQLSSSIAQVELRRLLLVVRDGAK